MELNKDMYRPVFAHAGEAGDAYLDMILKESEVSCLDSKTHELVYLGVLAAAPRLESGVGMHAKEAKRLGATREEVKSAVLTALPAVGFPAILALSDALKGYDE